MPYGANRQQIATDAFDTDIGPAWDNGWADWHPFTATGTGLINVSLTGDCGMRRNTGTYANDQYSTVTIQTHNTDGVMVNGAMVRCAEGAADESCYYGVVISAGGGHRYEVGRVDASNQITILATAGTAAPLAAGDTITLEVEGDLLRLGTSEGGGADTERLTVNDSTLTGGRPGVGLGFSQAGADDSQISAWEGGSIVAGGCNDLTVGSIGEAVVGGSTF
jgi:hypothetical protein